MKKIIIDDNNIIIYDDIYKLFNSYFFVHKEDRKIDINKSKLINEMINIKLPNIDTLKLNDDFGKVIKNIINSLYNELTNNKINYILFNMIK